jgi:hypothetical protein
MKIILLATILSVSSATPLLPLVPPRLGNGQGQSRSPCPFLNAAANHGLLPYSGTNVSAEDMDKLLESVGVPPAFRKRQLDGFEAIKRIVNRRAISLSELNVHNVIEHDLSLSRWASPNKTLDVSEPPSVELVTSMITFAQGVQAARPAAKQVQGLDADTVNQWRMERYKQERARNSTLTFSLSQAITAAGQCSLMLNIMGHGGRISYQDTKTFFQDETFPATWKPVPATNMDMFGTMLTCLTGFIMKGGWAPMTDDMLARVKAFMD